MPVTTPVGNARLLYIVVLTHSSTARILSLRSGFKDIPERDFVGQPVVAQDRGSRARHRGVAGGCEHHAPAPRDDYELHHIYDSRIPVIGVGEGSWPALVEHLQQLTDLPTTTCSSTCGARANTEWPLRMGAVRPGLHALLRTEGSILRLPPVGRLSRRTPVRAHARPAHRCESARHRAGGRRRRDHLRGPGAERYDLVFDARGFPGSLTPSTTSISRSSRPTPPVIRPLSVDFRCQARGAGLQAYLHPGPWPAHTAGSS